MPEDTTRILPATDGHLGLGMLDHAAEELEGLASKTREDFLSNRYKVLLHAEQWGAAREIAKHLVAMNPSNAQHWISWAHATRWAGNIKAAREILQQAKPLHPAEPGIDYHVACYACRLGERELAEALSLLKGAIRASSALKATALEEADLEPLLLWG